MNSVRICSVSKPALPQQVALNSLAEKCFNAKIKS